MARMINADDLAKRLSENRIVKPMDVEGCRIGEFKSMFGVPVVDAEPVKHGHWIGCGFNGDGGDMGETIRDYVAHGGNALDWMP